MEWRLARNSKQGRREKKPKNDHFQQRKVSRFKSHERVYAVSFSGLFCSKKNSMHEWMNDWKNEPAKKNSKRRREKSTTIELRGCFKISTSVERSARRKRNRTRCFGDKALWRQLPSVKFEPRLQAEQRPVACGLWLMAYGLWLMAYGLCRCKCAKKSSFHLKALKKDKIFHHYQWTKQILLLWRLVSLAGPD